MVFYTYIIVMIPLMITFVRTVREMFEGALSFEKGIPDFSFSFFFEKLCFVYFGPCQTSRKISWNLFCHTSPTLFCFYIPWHGLFFTFTSHFTGFSVEWYLCYDTFTYGGIMVFSGKLAMANRWQKILPGVPMWWSNFLCLFS